MVLVYNDVTWTFGLCSIYILCNMLIVYGFDGDKKDLVFVSDGKDFQKHYRLEDFFWTGTEDDPESGNLFNNDTDIQISVVQASPVETWRTTTVFHTTTILFATVFPDSESCTESKQGCKPQVSPVQTQSIDFSLPTFTSMVPDIVPCPTQKIPLTDTFEFPKHLPDDMIGGDTNVLGESSTPTISATKSTTSSKAGTNDSGFLTPGVLNANNTTVFPETFLDQKYWIMTVLRSDNFSPNMELNSTEIKLASLYGRAFNRRQEKYFGGKDFLDRKERKMSDSVKVHILNMTQTGKNVEIIYSVTVGGKPIPAMAAANDMRLMTASEVIAELGHPILSKAEPYIKNVVPLGARVKGRTRDTWLFIGSVIAAVLLLIILAVFFAVALSKKRTRRSTAKGMSNRRRVFEEEEGSSNLAFEGDVDSSSKNYAKRTHKNESRYGDSKIVNESARTVLKSTEDERRGSTTSSSCSGSSEASLVRLRHQQKMKERKLEEKEEKPRPKPRTRLRKIESVDCGRNYQRHRPVQSADSAVSRNTFEEIETGRYDDLGYSPCLARSLTSYLSMPSVKAFPRGTKIPEPLNKILEPTSIRHLDADSDSPTEYPPCQRGRHQEVDIEEICEVKNKSVRRKAMTRHASLEGDDPGFIGPVVWNRHCQKISGETVIINSENVEETDENINVGRMRKRFNELLDDALSMFGSRNDSPEGSEVVPARQLDNRVHSAIVRPADVHGDNAAAGRPKTTGAKRPQSSLISGPRGAWETPSCSTLARPVTAEVFRKSSPTIDKNLIYVNSDLPPSDPAIPLIAAIKSELQKFEDPSK